jgi:hypothetical protein
LGLIFAKLRKKPYAVHWERRRLEHSLADCCATACGEVACSIAMFSIRDLRQDDRIKKLKHYLQI